MTALLAAASLICLFQRLQPNNKIAIPNRYLVGGIIYLIVFFLISLVRELSIEINITIVARFVDFYVQYGLASFIILICWSDCISLRKYLFSLVLTHCILAFFTLYGAYIGLDLFSLLNNVLYLEPEELASIQYKSMDPLLIRGDFLMIIKDKYSSYIMANFGNPNILGFYAGTLCLLSVLCFYEKKMRLVATLSLVLGLILWLDTGTRAPLFSVLIVIVYDLVSRKKVLLPIILFICVVCAPVAIVYYNSQLAGGMSASVESRKELMDIEWPFFLNHLALGSTSKDSLAASPHQLWLLYGTYYGFIGMLFSIVYFYLYPLLDIKKKLNHFTIGVIASLFLISNTNNFTAIVLYMTLFAAFVAEVYLPECNTKKIAR